MSINELYNVLVEDYAKRHFIKSFEKKYKSVWSETFSTIENMLIRIELFINTTKIEKIHCSDFGYIAKCEFKIAGSNESPKTSGNRIIIYVDKMNKEVKLLLLYSKTDFGGNNETSWWEGEIKTNYPELKKLFSGL